LEYDVKGLKTLYSIVYRISSQNTNTIIGLKKILLSVFSSPLWEGQGKGDEIKEE
jgi:hypothetical protein